MQPHVVQLPFVYDPLIDFMIGFLALFLTVRFFVRWWDLAAL